MTARRFPLPKRVSVAFSEKACANLRALHDKYHYGNNYLLTVLLENLDTIVDPAAVEKVFAAFEEEYGAPAPGTMQKK